MKEDVIFYVWPVSKKPKGYSDLNLIMNDFTPEELEGATIQVLYRGTVIGVLNTDTVVQELEDVVEREFLNR